MPRTLSILSNLISIKALRRLHCPQLSLLNSGGNWDPEKLRNSLIPGKIPWRKERLPTPVFWPSPWRVYMDCIVHGVAKTWTWLSDFHFTSLPTSVENQNLQKKKKKRGTKIKLDVGNRAGCHISRAFGWERSLIWKTESLCETVAQAVCTLNLSLLSKWLRTYNYWTLFPLGRNKITPLKV